MDVTGDRRGWFFGYVGLIGPFDEGPGGGLGVVGSGFGAGGGGSGWRTTFLQKEAGPILESYDCFCGFVDRIALLDGASGGSGGGRLKVLYRRRWVRLEKKFRRGETVHRCGRGTVTSTPAYNPRAGGVFPSQEAYAIARGSVFCPVVLKSMLV